MVGDSLSLSLLSLSLAGQCPDPAKHSKEFCLFLYQLPPAFFVSIQRF